MDFRRSLEMTLSREEFLRLLAAVVPSFSVDADTVRWSEGGRRRAIHLVSLPDRLVGTVPIRRHHVEIVLDVDRDSEGEAFMARFHRAFMRGGG